MKKLVFCVLMGVILSCSHSRDLTVSVSNLSGREIVDYTVEIPESQYRGLPLGDYFAVVDDEKVPVEIATGLLGDTRLIFPVAVLHPHETKTVPIRPGRAEGYPKRTYAELSHKIGGHFEGQQYVDGFSWVKPNYLRVPDNFKDHAYYIKYEGPGWESDKVAFRFYLDQRNAIDVFGKKTPEIVLPFVGVDGYESYHHMADWGMDNMKVGSALGIGSIAVWDGKKAVRVEKTDSVICHIPADGKIRSQVMTCYYGWEANGTPCNLRALLSIDAGSRASHMELRVDREIEGLATGLNKDRAAAFFSQINEEEEWSYIATFGKQSLNDDNMGLALLVKTKYIREITEDDRNHLVLLKPENGFVDYYFMPTWELDWQPVATKDDFIKCIDEVMARLSSPVEIKIN
ncbi:MAG: DUF4861 domain-containing protein [Dysgonamonadaceae bacterium]|jgi:hypothetical protein|nr:DUF4861 domain-containing protein [Dysgonamonadaceae bacterium]